QRRGGEGGCVLRGAVSPRVLSGTIMGMNLHSATSDFGWDTFSWVKLLRLAEHYGWRPSGTTLPNSELAWMPGGRWNGNYTTNDGQTVTTADANALASALEKAVQDIPSDDTIAHYRTPS